MNTKIDNFYQLDVWQKGHEFVLDIYKTTKNFPKEELYGITSQLRRAASSITANIAEGFERFYFKDKIRFYYQSRGSMAEVQNFLFLALDLELITRDQCDIYFEKANTIGRLINGLIRSSENQNKK